MQQDGTIYTIWSFSSPKLAISSDYGYCCPAGDNTAAAAAAAASGDISNSHCLQQLFCLDLYDLQTDM